MQTRQQAESLWTGKEYEYEELPIYRNDKIVTTLSQPWHKAFLQPSHHLGTTLYLKLWQGCYKVVARLSQGCTNIFTRLPQCTLSQPWHNLVFETVARLLQGGGGGGMVVTRLYEHCHKVATMHLGTTLYFETVARLLQGGGKAVTKALSLINEVLQPSTYSYKIRLVARIFKVVRPESGWSMWLTIFPQKVINKLIYHVFSNTLLKFIYER